MVLFFFNFNGAFTKKIIFKDLHQIIKNHQSSAASTLLHMLAKRQGVMQKILEYIMQNLTPDANAYQIDGALHMIAVVSNQLIISKV